MVAFGLAGALFLACGESQPTFVAQRSGLTFLVESGSGEKKQRDGTFQAYLQQTLHLVNRTDTDRVVHWTSVKVDDKLASSWHEMVSLSGDADHTLQFWTQLDAEEPFRPGRKVSLFRLKAPSLAFDFRRTELEVCSCAVGETDCQHALLDRGVTHWKSVASCEEQRSIVVLYDP